MLTLTQLCAELHNYFYARPSDIHKGTFTISHGSIDLDFLDANQYFRIKNSKFNDGVWKYGAQETVLVDEVFEGEIWAMSVPPDALALLSEIDDWITANADILTSPFNSESFGGYSYTKAGSGGYGGEGSPVYSWQAQFASRLKPYRRFRDKI